MDKPTVGYLYNGVLLGDKKGWAIDTHDDMMKLKIMILSERSQTKKRALVPFI